MGGWPFGYHFKYGFEIGLFRGPFLGVSLRVISGAAEARPLTESFLNRPPEIIPEQAHKTLLPDATDHPPDPAQDDPTPEAS